jgi:hypothetical protein
MNQTYRTMAAHLLGLAKRLTEEEARKEIQQALQEAHERGVKERKVKDVG